jgi:hypothetical protein
LIFFKEQKLPVDKGQAAQIVRRSHSYVLVGYQLYRSGASSSILMKCVSIEKGKEILDEMHSECCGNHAASRTLVGKAF